MNPRRKQLANLKLTSTTNAGLWFDKFLAGEGETNERAGARPVGDDRARREGRASETPKPKGRLMGEVALLRESETPYPAFYKRWKQSLEEHGAKTRLAEARGRMIVGLGAESVSEVSVALHRTYGVPYIPGSALKGLAASFARQRLSDEWRQDDKAYKTLFGNSDEAGYVTFFDALYEPKSGTHKVSLYQDVLTVHHQQYYQGDQPPADWDDPNPVSFLSATGSYLVALAGPDDCVKTAFDILGLALNEEGVGAKTSSGYGRLALQGAPINPEQLLADELIGRINAMRDVDVPGRIGQHVEKWRALTNDTQKRRVAEAIVARVRAIRKEKDYMQKAWYQEVVKGAQ